MSNLFSKTIKPFYIHLKKIIDTNIFVRSIIALSVPISLILICGSYVGWNTSITAIKFDVKLTTLIIGGSILCALDGFWYVKSFSQDP